MALEEENQRRRDECIQLRSILAQRSHGSPSKMNGFANGIDHSDDHSLQESELLQAFEAQKVVNRQLESELTALTEENNSKIMEMSKEIDELRSERNQFQEIMHNQIRSTDQFDEYHSINSSDNSVIHKQQNIDYLMAEIKSISAAYTQVLVRRKTFFGSSSFASFSSFSSSPSPSSLKEEWKRKRNLLFFYFDSNIIFSWKISLKIEIFYGFCIE